MASLSLAEAIGSVTGNDAARAKIAGALLKGQHVLEGKAEGLGQKLGLKFGGNIFSALAKGATSGEAAATDALVQEQTGVTMKQVVTGAKYGGLLLAGLAVIAAAIFFKRRA